MSGLRFAIGAVEEREGRTANKNVYDKGENRDRTRNLNQDGMKTDNLRMRYILQRTKYRVG